MVNRNLIEHILRDVEVRKNYYELIKTQRKICHKQATVEFLKECLERRLIPDTFRVKIFQRMCSGSILLKHKWHLIESNASYNLMMLAIEDIQLDIPKLVKHNLSLYSWLQNILNEDDMKYLEASLSNKMNRIIIQVYNRNRRRVNKLWRCIFTVVQDKIKSLRAYKNWQFDKCYKSQQYKSLHKNRIDIYRQQNFGIEAESDMTKTNDVIFFRAKRGHDVNKSKKRRFRRKKGATDIPLEMKNYSDHVFDEHVKSLLSKGRSFVPIPKLNKTEILRSVVRMERNLRLKWHHYTIDKNDGTEQYADEPKPNPIPLPPKKVDLEKLKLPPAPLMEFIHGIKGTLNTVKPWKKFPNLKKEEQKALSSLISLQKKGKIVVMRCDKTGGFAVVNREDYVKDLKDLLAATIEDDNGVQKSCYEKIDMSLISKHHIEIKRFVKLGLQEGLYDKRIADALVPKEPSCGRLYGLLKDHKPLINGNRIPPIRAVISGSGSNTEQISRFLDFYIKPLVKTLPSFVEDTKDF